MTRSTRASARVAAVASSKAKSEDQPVSVSVPATRASKRVAKAKAVVKAEDEDTLPAPTRSSKRIAAKGKKTENAPAAATPSTKKKSKAKTKSKSKKRKAEQVPAEAEDGSPTKKRTTGMKGTVNTAAPLGVVDPQSKLEGSIYLHQGDPLDAMLVLIDPSKNMDKYFVLQLVVLDEPSSKGAYALYSRWGRTGTAGSGLTEMFSKEEKAFDAFCLKFEEKTALTWNDRHEEENTAPEDGKQKYRYVVQNYAAKQEGYAGAIWQYWVDDYVDGKPTGWYNYDSEGSQIVEQLFHEASHLPQGALRFVQSGAWVYLVNLDNMIQTNTGHPNHTTRHIRRLSPDGSFIPEESGPTGPPNAAQDMVVFAANTANVNMTQANLFASMAPQMRKPSIANFNNGQAATSAKVQPPHTVVKAPPAIVPSVKNEPEPESQAEEEGVTAAAKEIPVDFAILIAGVSADDFIVVDDYDVTLNQCNITEQNNNNKYYRMQLLHNPSEDMYYAWTRWGRVGEEPRKSTSGLLGPHTLDGATREFEKKFKAKTGNAWANRDDFKPKKGKYEPVLTDANAQIKDEDEEGGSSTIKGVKHEYEPSKLDSKTKDLIEVIYNKDMMTDALLDFNIDVKRMPLGALDPQQVHRGAAVLEDIETALGENASVARLKELSSKFYTTIPHSFGRKVPPVINTPELLRQKFDMLDVLLDIESTSSKVDEINKRNAATERKTLPNPADAAYAGLGATLKLVDPSSKQYAIVKKYFDATKGSSAEILDVWEVDRNNEGARFNSYSQLDNRRLLWHGTGVEVVAAILGSGLRIMPHSGGRVGKGIYLANEMGKSAQYTRSWCNKFACMFLCEAALGKIAEITQDDSTLTKAPHSFDSVLAKGTQSPKIYIDTTMDGKKVAVPQSEPAPSGVQSTFFQDEYLVYDEAQVRLRFVCTVKLGW